MFTISIVLVMMQLYNPPTDDGFDGIGTLISLGTFFLYYFIFETLTKGRTPGKYITKTKLISTNKQAPTSGDYAIRTLTRFIPFEAFTAFSKNAEMWHDSFAKTKVVRLD